MTKKRRTYKQLSLCYFIGHRFTKRSYATVYQGVITLLECSICGAVIKEPERIKRDA